MNLYDQNYNENFFTETVCTNTNDFNNKTKNVNGMFIMHFNIQSIDSKFNQLEVYLKTVSIRPKIIVLSETWQFKNPNLYNLDGYNLIYNESNI